MLHDATSYYTRRGDYLAWYVANPIERNTMMVGAVHSTESPDLVGDARTVHPSSLTLEYSTSRSIMITW